MFYVLIFIFETVEQGQQSLDNGTYVKILLLILVYIILI